MRLHEYQVKYIFNKHQIKIPESYLAQNVEEVVNAVYKLGPCILKAQVLVGGRGKAGGICRVANREEAERKARELFGTLIKGCRVDLLLVEKSLNITKEMYLAFILDKNIKQPSLIFSPIGGINIEDIAKIYPESLFKISYEYLYGLQEFQLRELLFKAGFSGTEFKEMLFWLRSINNIAQKYDAELVEINPFVKADNIFYAADAVLIADDNALFRQDELSSMENINELDELENEARKENLNYIRLNGDIGVIANGAGLAMTTMDMLTHMNGNPANFMDTGGGLADPDKMEKHITHVLNDPNVKSVFINIYAEITRCEKVAQGIAQSLAKTYNKKPIIIKMTGVNEAEGKSILKNSSDETGVEIYIVNSLEEGAEKAVLAARGS